MSNLKECKSCSKEVAKSAEDRNSTIGNISPAKFEEMELAQAA